MSRKEQARKTLDLIHHWIGHALDVRRERVHSSDVGHVSSLAQAARDLAEAEASVSRISDAPSAPKRRRPVAPGKTSRREPSRPRTTGKPRPQARPAR